jgi:HlyD family secretion protein
MDILIPTKKRSFVTRWWWLKARLLAGTGATSLYQSKPGQQPYGTARRLTSSPITRGNLQEFTATDGLVQPLHTVCLDALRRQRRPTPLPLQAQI